MGEVADTMTKKKKKGRPSLLDLQKRALKQQQLQQQQHKNQDDSLDNHRSGSKNPNSLNQPPNSARRSKRRDSNPNGVSSDSAWIKDDEEDEDARRAGDEDDDERREKKHRLLHGLNSHSHRHSPNSQSGGSDLNLEDASETPEASINRRKITGGARGSDYTGEKALKATDILQGSPVESGPTTPLPDKKLLVFILDRLQKKDTYGVYSDPVDPEELPDYHEIIKNPMDFSTVRKKLESGVYANLEQFERDVFLICTNAMEYNSADTVYYKQARGILELAKKDFENLRRDSDDEEPQQQQQQQQPQPKVVKRGRPPKKQPDQSSIDRTASEISADVLTHGGDNSRVAGVYNLRKAPPSYKYRPAETSVRVNHNSETQSGFSVDWENEFPPSVVKAVNKYGMKHFNVDDNRRDTYNYLSTSLHEPSVLTTLEDELKQLIPVGLNTEYGYARSMARYAANLGPVAWKMASRKIENVIPSGIKFGPGWVGDNPTPEEDNNNTQQPNLGKQKCSNDLASDDHSNRMLSPTTSVSSAFIGNRHSSHGIEETTPGRVLNQETEFVAGQSINHPSSSSSSRQIHHPGPLINPESNGLIRGFSGFSHSPNPMVGISRQLQHSNEQQGLFPYIKQEFHRFPPDLNARLVSPNSPGSNQQTGSSSSQHPDLALQL